MATKLEEGGGALEIGTHMSSEIGDFFLFNVHYCRKKPFEANIKVLILLFVVREKMNKAKEKRKKVK